MKAKNSLLLRLLYCWVFTIPVAISRAAKRVVVPCLLYSWLKPVIAFPLGSFNHPWARSNAWIAVSHLHTAQLHFQADLNTEQQYLLIFYWTPASRCATLPLFSQAWHTLKGPLLPALEYVDQGVSHFHFLARRGNTLEGGDAGTWWFCGMKALQKEGSSASRTNRAQAW